MEPGDRPDIKEAENVYCAGCDLLVAPGTKYTVQVRNELYHGDCYETARRRSKISLVEME